MSLNELHLGHVLTSHQDRKASPAPTGATDETRVQDGKDGVIVTTNFTVTRDVL